MLSLRQEEFCQLYVKLGVASKAYREAFNVAADAAPQSVTSRASRLMSLEAIRNRIEELKLDVAERHRISIDSLIKELDDAREVARDAAHAAPMVAATMGKAKILGMIVDRKEVTVHSMISSMSDAELASFIDEVDVDDDDYNESE